MNSPTGSSAHRHGMASEVAALLGVTRARLPQLAATYPDFPAPADTLKAGSVWHLADVEAWAAAHPDRKRGRPRKQPTAPTP